MKLSIPDKVLRASKPKLKSVNLSDLVDVLEQICRLSIVTQSEKSSSWDYDRCIPFLEENGLYKNITFVSRPHKSLPPNSERHLYEMNNIIIRNLDLKLDNRSGWSEVSEWKPLSYAKWHFENCQFTASSSNMWTIDFPWRGSFRFYKNRFDFQKERIVGYWLFVFENGSRVLFQSNDFSGDSVQTRSVSSVKDGGAEGDGVIRALSAISFVGNRGISDLKLLEGYSSIAFTGMNRIESLWLQEISEFNDAQGKTVFFGPREKVDQNFHYCLQHRKLFQTLKNFAAANHDLRQVSVLDKQIERIEYHLNKDQDIPLVVDFRIWIEYWQDRMLYAWRRWSSDFYKSWMRPLLMVIVGYMILNAMPWFFLDGFSVSHWIEFNFRPIGELPNYEESLSRIVGIEYRQVSPFRKNILRFVGLVEVVWIAMWSFSFARAIRR